MTADTLSVPIRFRLAEHALWTARRRMRRVGYDLVDLLDARALRLPPLGEADGFDLRSIPETMLTALSDTKMLRLVRQRYPRHFIRLDAGWPAYWNGFSAKTRSTLKRKRARWTEAASGLTVGVYRTPDEVDAFVRLAGELSARTYQGRLLDAGLPTDATALAAMRRDAAAGDFRGFILFHGEQAAAYLHLPVTDGVVLYAHLGYDPAFAALSPGTVLQLEALERLFAEPGLRLFDFTEGDGAHKRLFGREAVDCADVLLLRPSVRNRLLLTSLSGFDRAVAAIGRTAEARGWKPKLKRLLRR